MVRQRLLHQMINVLGYPKSLIAVEKKFGAMNRRADIVCYARGIHAHMELSPLLVVECKADDELIEAREQALGYNAALLAPFLCIAGKTQIHTLWLNGDKIASVPFLPPYCDLLKMVNHAKS